ncbi:hypothetical protein Tco_0221124 [Tanacetum coccineum]
MSRVGLQEEDAHTFDNFIKVYDNVFEDDILDFVNVEVEAGGGPINVSTSLRVRAKNILLKVEIDSPCLKGLKTSAGELAKLGYGALSNHDILRNWKM